MTELGKKLKEAREEKNLTLDDLQDITKIQKRYLIAIEQGKYESIPGKFYVRAFIKQYADAVGLKPEELFDEYRTDIPSSYEEDLPEQLSRTQTRKVIPKGTSKFLEILPKLILALFAVGAAVFVWYLIQKTLSEESSVVENPDNGNQVEFEDGKPVGEKPDGEEGDQGENDGDPVDNEEPQEEPDVEEKPVVEPQLTFVENDGTESIYELSNAESIELTVSAAEGKQTWINIIDGSNSELFRGTLDANKEELEQKQQSFELTDQESVWIRIGNVSGTEVIINGITLEFQESELVDSTHNFTIRLVNVEE